MVKQKWNVPWNWYESAKTFDEWQSNHLRENNLKIMFLDPTGKVVSDSYSDGLEFWLVSKEAKIGDVIE